MIYIYYSFYEEDLTGQEKNSEREHRIGLELLCRGLSELYGICAENMDSMLCEGEFGKPYLRERPDISFNISHCRGLVVCAFLRQTGRNDESEHTDHIVSEGQPDQAIGIDVEAVKPVRDPLIRRVLHEEELQVLSRFGEIAVKAVSGREDKVRASETEKTGKTHEEKRSPEFLRLFFRYWTLKESYLNRDGCGLTKEPREICFTVDPEDWESPVYTSDPDVVCIQKLFTEAHTGEFILSVCVPRGAEKAGLQMVKY